MSGRGRESVSVSLDLAETYAPGVASLRSAGGAPPLSCASEEAQENILRPLLAQWSSWASRSSKKMLSRLPAEDDPEPGKVSRFFLVEERAPPRDAGERARDTWAGDDVTDTDTVVVCTDGIGSDDAAVESPTWWYHDGGGADDDGGGIADDDGGAAVLMLRGGGACARRRHSTSGTTRCSRRYEMESTSDFIAFIISRRLSLGARGIRKEECVSVRRQKFGAMPTAREFARRRNQLDS